jgi:hypothetical protein
MSFSSFGDDYGNGLEVRITAIERACFFIQMYDSTPQSTTPFLVYPHLLHKSFPGFIF